MSYQYKIALSYATENEKLVEKVYHYLRAEKIDVFFAPSPEGQVFLSGKNQREAFYYIFGVAAEYVALFVSEHYLIREVPMEEARIAFAKHGANGSVIPVYLDKTFLPEDLLDPKKTNYFRSNDPAEIAIHLAAKIKSDHNRDKTIEKQGSTKNIMEIKGNTAEKQIFIQTMEGNIEL